MSPLPTPTNPPSRLPLIAFAVAVACLLPRQRWPELLGPWLVLLGVLAVLLCCYSLYKSHHAQLRLRFGVLLTCLAVLTIAPISTNTSNMAVLVLGSCFAAVVIGPYLWSRCYDPGLIGYQLLPKHLDWREVGYVLLSVPLAWGGFWLYFWLSPAVPLNWSLPPSIFDPNAPEPDVLLRLFIGINAVGIWDELFFINTVYAILRSIYPFWLANFGQSVVYTSLLYAMAFSGVGPLFVFTLAITQGIMFERSKNLLYVLLVHLIVDYFLFQAILSAQYPGFKAWWHP
jgi:membrane protease YdiL (CAAX protease family)